MSPSDPGHTLYADSPWALTSISQKQFWRDASLSNYGNGDVGGLLSVDISEWESPGILVKKPAMECTADEIESEVWAELKVHLNVGSGKSLTTATCSPGSSIPISNFRILRW